ncbi:class I SAM-dependent methyltransferase [Olsenella profusa]|uniref:Ribosomal RNA small subunit methyltransferase J n=1 Tax=Olsenella profusa TaxID=138595 RepID=A0ABS2F1B0_9ACTN|nr:class I SAM-dependent methyltransferase [Olsenella profusa]MBM6774587.1 class I SAM-dependent methyltransferase [Olsenella profusa]
MGTEGKRTGAPRAGDVELVRRADGLALVGDGMELMADLTRMLPRLRPDRLGRELLVRAARVRGVESPTAVDATAGLGEDALLLAAAGFTVTLYERDPVIAALLRDALARAADVPALAGPVARMELVEGDSTEALRALGVAPDVVFLDPMFPERRKSAAVKKKFQLLHHLERPCEDEAALLDAALAAHPRKVVVKRPPKGPHLAGVKPSYEFTGKAVRYDVIVPPPRQAAPDAAPGQPGAREERP